MDDAPPIQYHTAKLDLDLWGADDPPPDCSDCHECRDCCDHDENIDCHGPELTEDDLESTHRFTAELYRLVGRLYELDKQIEDAGDMSSLRRIYDDDSVEMLCYRLGIADSHAIVQKMIQKCDEDLLEWFTIHPEEHGEQVIVDGDRIRLADYDEPCDDDCKPYTGPLPFTDDWTECE